MRNGLLLAALMLLVALATALFLALKPVYLAPDPLAGTQGYAAHDLALSNYDLFDLGVADINADSWLDVFTVNHSATQSFLAGREGGGFDPDSLTDAFPQDPVFVATEDSLQAPVMEHPGLYVYRQARWLTLQARDVPEHTAFEGEINLPWRLELDEHGTDKAAVVSMQVTDAHSTIAFRLQGDQRLMFRGHQDIIELPHTIALQPGTALSTVFVGRALSNPADVRFSLHWRDRHAMAWSDVNGDGRSDAFVARGGVKGRLAEVTVPVFDELLMWQPPGTSAGPSRAHGDWQDVIETTGLSKKGCPARQTHWVDAGADGRLDLHVVCSRHEPRHPDQLWIQADNGRFSDQALQVGLANPGDSVGVWLDADNDGDNDYLAGQGARLMLFENTRTGFAARELATLQQGTVAQWALGDHDNDGYLDAFAAGRKDARLLVQSAGGWQVLPAGEKGLPARAASANWVDFDNDGDLDLHTLPGGLFRQEDNGHFTRTGRLRFSGKPELQTDGMCTWFDNDGNGRLDVLCGVTYYPNRLARAWLKIVMGRTLNVLHSSSFHSADDAGGHWLHVQLSGAVGNAEALGAEVRLSSGGREQVRVVGQAEGALYSQGHYRLYFGLGGEPVVDELIVKWPDGTESQWQNLPADELLYIQQGSEMLSRTHPYQTP